MRMLRLRAALTAFVRRWGAYLATAVVVFSAGSNAPVAIGAALVGALVWPLREAAGHGVAIVPVALAYAVVGAGPVVLSRPLWWPRAWAAAERALPLLPAAIRRSDLRFAARITSVWQGLLAAGAAGLAVGDGTPAAAVVRVVAVGGWLLSLAGSLALSVAWMRWVRRAPHVTAGRKAVGRNAVVRARERRDRQRTFVATGTVRALVVAPMMRRRAPRSATALLAGVATVTVAATASAWSATSLPWSLAAVATIALVATGVLRAATLRELQPLWRAHRALPLAEARCERARLATVLAPMIVGLASAIVTALAVGADRPKALAAFVASVVVGCVIEARTSPAMPSQDRAARWVLLLATALACASETVAT